MAESFIQVPPDSTGKKPHTWSYVIGANTVEDEVVIQGPQPWPSGFVNAAVAAGVANDHALTLNAPAALKVRVVRIRVEQRANATAVNRCDWQIVRTTTGAPTGGTVVTPAPHETTDTISSLSRSLPGVKGTEAAVLMDFSILARQALLATSAQADDPIWEWIASPLAKPIIIPAGVANGLAIKNLSAPAGASWNVMFEFVETAF